MDKHTTGLTLLSALAALTSSSTPTPIVLIGHDRGARIAHRLTVSGAGGVSIHGTCLIDIVPTAVQWQHGAAAHTAAAETIGYFHWPFLANTDLAVRMINAFGRGAWCEEMTLRWAGSNAGGLAALKADDALAVYNAFFAQPGTLEASCDDYAAGAREDVQVQVSDQQDGRKMVRPVLLVYSADGIGSRFDMAGAWRDWVSEEARLTTCALEDGIGHFGAEEAPGETARALGEWLGGLSE